MPDDGLGDAEPKLGEWFETTWHGQCEGCGDVIGRYERARYVNDEVHCEDCGKAAEDE